MKVFLYDIENNNEFDDSQTNDETDLEAALIEFYNLSEENGSFFGIIDEHNNCIQFAWEAQDKWLVDIPKPPNFLNLQKFANYDECVDIIKKIFYTKEIKEFDGMQKIDTMKDSLREMNNKIITNKEKQINYITNRFSILKNVPRVERLSVFNRSKKSPLLWGVLLFLIIIWLYFFGLEIIQLSGNLIGPNDFGSKQKFISVFKKTFIPAFVPALVIIITFWRVQAYIIKKIVRKEYPN